MQVPHVAVAVHIHTQYTCMLYTFGHAMPGHNRLHSMGYSHFMNILPYKILVWHSHTLHLNSKG